MAKNIQLAKSTQLLWIDRSYIPERHHAAHIQEIKDLLTTTLLKQEETISDLYSLDIHGVSNLQKDIFPSVNNEKFSTEYINKLGECLRDSLVESHAEIVRKELSELTPTTVQVRRKSNPEPWAAPMQSFEGRIVDIVNNGESMTVILTDKTGQLPDHEATIDIEWVPDQDKDLVKPGAIFYLSLYKEKNRGSVRNSQEIRFRRLPNWSQTQIDSIRSQSKSLLSKLGTKPLASLSE